MDLVANSKGMSDEELSARKHDLKREQKVQFSSFLLECFKIYICAFIIAYV